MKKILEILSQPSTWRGIALLGAAIGYPVSEDLQGLFTQLAMVSASLISIFWEV